MLVDDLRALAARLETVADFGALEVADGIGKVWADTAARRAPVDTGQLKARTTIASTTGGTTRATATVVSDVPYAGFVEFGHRAGESGYVPPNPYFRAGQMAAVETANRFGGAAATDLRRVLSSGGVWNPRSLLP